MENSNIAWTTNTFNPWIGCTEVGDGCLHCYAKAQDARFDPEHIARHWGPGAPRRRTAPQNWNKARKWEREAIATGIIPWVFCASLADVFDNEAPEEAREDLWQLVRETPHLRWQFVTKRIGNAGDMMPLDWRNKFQHCGIVATVVTQAEADRDIPKLLTVKQNFKVRWIGLSIEPQLESVVPRGMVDWIITGGESAQGGAQARPYDPEWARMLIQFGFAYGIKIFVKQMGSNPIGLKLRDRAGADPSEWPADLRIQEMPVL